jgi:hypothetical protein
MQAVMRAVYRWQSGLTPDARAKSNTLKAPGGRQQTMRPSNPKELTLKQ